MLSKKTMPLQTTRKYSTSASFSSDSSTKSSLSLVNSNNDLMEDAPDHLLDPISYEVFTDPVITPSGITYEKETILNHMKKKGKYDPISKQELSKDQLYPNLVIKDSVEAYKNDSVMKKLDSVQL